MVTTHRPVSLTGHRCGTAFVFFLFVHVTVFRLAQPSSVTGCPVTSFMSMLLIRYLVKLAQHTLANGLLIFTFVSCTPLFDTLRKAVIRSWTAHSACNTWTCYVILPTVHSVSSFICAYLLFNMLCCFCSSGCVLLESRCATDIVVFNSNICQLCYHGCDVCTLCVVTGYRPILTSESHHCLCLSTQFACLVQFTDLHWHACHLFDVLSWLQQQCFSLCCERQLQLFAKASESVWLMEHCAQWYNLIGTLIDQILQFCLKMFCYACLHIYLQSSMFLNSGAKAHYCIRHAHIRQLRLATGFLGYLYEEQAAFLRATMAAAETGAASMKLYVYAHRNQVQCSLESHNATSDENAAHLTLSSR